ncbi:MAG: methionine--tRNA ligase [Saprospiraceae bacterium]|jgi:methionyl-tRNA synthetase|nr:methionine--tRNA ligase [Saprospiraceae bacterium]MBL0259741.1 methionine--tRNA ligase [Saprospiraceae bacterium]
MLEYNRYLVTSALPYANGPLHIGHLSGAYLSADVFVRFMRMMDKDIVFICGSDENGAAITMRALKESKTPQEIIDTYHEMFVKTFEGIGISFDHYGRTSSDLHHKTSQDFFRELLSKNQFVEQETEQYYDLEAQQFLADRYIMGTCPKCGHPDAYGDQCEKCGSSLNPIELISPRSVITGSVPELRVTRHWFLGLDQHEQWLKEWIGSGTLEGKEHHDPEAWKNHVVGQCKSWLDAGLSPRSMTRDLDWGVDVPQEIPGSKGKKLYVWLDAPIGYISATKQWAADHQKDWKDYWQKEDSALIHFIGKDNIVFHCIIFPAILKAHGQFNLPVNVPANQFMNLEGQKISTSRNWAVWVHEYLADFPNMQDSLRYYLCKNMPEQKDSEFTWKLFQEAHNTELVNNLSNFIHRVFVLADKYFKGVVPDFDPDYPFEGVAGDELGGYHETELLYLFDQIQAMNQCLREYDFRGALKYVMDISSSGNLLLQKNEPWKNFKNDPEWVEVVMNLALQYVACLSVIVRPFLPFTSDKLRTMLGLDRLEEKGELVKMLDELAEGGVIISPHHKLAKFDYLFTKIDDSVIDIQIQKLAGQDQQRVSGLPDTQLQYAEQKSEISIDDFIKLDLRTARIILAEIVPKADKLLQLTLDLGFEKRTVLSGIAEHYKPDEIIGKEVVVVANLAPRKIRGIESRGMILMAENAEGKLNFVSPDKKWQPGSTVK